MLVPELGRRRALGRAAGHPGAVGEEEKRLVQESNDAKSKTPPFQGPHPLAPRARLPRSEVDVDVPAVSRGQAAAPGLPEVRILQRPRSYLRQRNLTT